MEKKIELIDKNRYKESLCSIIRGMKNTSLLTNDEKDDGIQKLQTAINVLDNEPIIYKTIQEFQKDDFSDTEFRLLTLAFKLLYAIAESERKGNSDVSMLNDVFHLQEKLGIVDLLL